MKMFGGDYQPPGSSWRTIFFNLTTVAVFLWALLRLDMEEIGDVRVSIFFCIGAVCLLLAWLTGCGVDDLFTLFGPSHRCALKTPGYAFPVMGLAILLRRMLASMGYGRDEG
jgi:hypothetical protein